MISAPRLLITDASAEDERSIANKLAREAKVISEMTTMPYATF